MVKWLNSSFSNSLNFWDSWFIILNYFICFCTSLLITISGLILAFVFYLLSWPSCHAHFVYAYKLSFLFRWVKSTLKNQKPIVWNSLCLLHFPGALAIRKWIMRIVPHAFLQGGSADTCSAKLISLKITWITFQLNRAQYRKRFAKWASAATSCLSNRDD